MVRNDLSLVKRLLPIWKRFADGFVFYVDTSTNDLLYFLDSVKDEYNILEVIVNNRNPEDLTFETDMRQILFDTGKKYSDYLICLDNDEYLAGKMSKMELINLLKTNKNTVFNLRWRQYTSVNTIRIDGPWLNNYKDRIGSYEDAYSFNKTQMHSTHLPIPENVKYIEDDKLHIAHLQWMDKKFVAIKQYFWKICDYITNTLHNQNVVGYSAYDASVNDFEWEEKYDIPNLGDWGYDIVNIQNSEDFKINKYKISVITAIGDLNRYEKFIPRYIDNIKQQHFFKETEHIIVYMEWSNYFNDLQYLDNFKFIKEEESLGVYNAWNIGIKNSTTDYITNWNVDDIRHPLNTKIKYDLINNNPYDLVYSYYTAVNDELLTFDTIDINDSSYAAYPDEYHKYVLDGCYAGPDPMWRKSLHNVVGYFDYEKFNTIGDWEMWIRFANTGCTFKLLPYILCIYLDHQDTISTRQLDAAKNEKRLLNYIYGANPE